MRLKLLRPLTVISFFLLLSGNLKAQSCIPTNINGATINLLCNQVCSTLVFQVPHIKSTSDYTLSSIPFNPLPWTTAFGTQDLSLYCDDIYSAKFSMQFPFCFYDSVFTKVVIGSNGILTFDTTNASCDNSWPIGPTIYSTGGGTQCNSSATYYPKAAVMIAYSDLDPRPRDPSSSCPDANASGTGRKIEWRVEGNAPCRKFVVSYYNIGTFGRPNSTPLNTFQAILYESTGIIEYYFLNCTTSSTTNGGKAIMGIQNWTRDKATAHPQRNAVVWPAPGAINEGWRFTPSGGASRFVSTELYTIGGTLVMVGDTLTTTPGMLDLRFPNACFPAGSNQYVIKTTFSACDNPLMQLVSYDTITVSRLNSLGATATKTDASCGPPDGTITVTVPPGVGTPPYTFVLDGGAPVVAPSPYTFTNVASGPHTIDVTDATAGCTSTINITINLSGTISETHIITPTACAGVNNGSITINSAGGTGPYTFSIDGLPAVAGTIPYTFFNLASGTHTVIVNDISTGCNTGPRIIDIPPGVGVTANAVGSPTSCPGNNDGSIQVTAFTGTAPFTMILDGVTTLTGASPQTFLNVAAGFHNITITDINGCVKSLTNVFVPTGPGITANTSFTATACAAATNGTITVTPTNGLSPYTFSLDGGPGFSDPVSYTFNNVSSGSHTVTVTDATGCSTNPALLVIVAAGPGVTGTATPSATSCPSAANGQIVVNTTAGTAPFTYQLDGGAPQNGANPYTFFNVTSGSHNVIITDNFGCSLPINNIIVNAGPPLAASTISNSTSCSGASNGSITVTPTNGISPYTFSIDGGPAFADPVSYTFNNLAPGAHTIIVTDAAGCITNPPISETVVAGPVLATTASVSDVLCNGDATGKITVAQPAFGSPPFEYSLNGGSWQISNIFTGLTAGIYTVAYREGNGCQGSHQETVSEPTAMTSSAATVAAVCNGDANGIITITAGGGIVPYQYSIDGGVNWQPGNVFNVAAGTYTITIRDANNCTTTQSATVTEPAALTAASVNTNASCDGGDDGVITVNAAGGNSGYTYSIDGVNFQASNIFNVAPGPYTVAVKDNLGCTTSFNTVVDLTDNLTFTPQIDPTICEGTSTQLSLSSNGTIYLWSPSTGLSDTTIYNPVANPIATTQYIVTTTLGRCSAKDTVIVNVNAAPIPNAGADGFICYGQTYQLQGSGGTQYSWSPSTYLDDPQKPNAVSSAPKDIIYTLSIVSDINGCASLVTDEMRLDVTPPIKVQTFPFDTVAYSTDIFQLLAVPSDSDVINYSWSPSIGLDNPFIANPIVTAGAIGDVVQYQVTTSTIAGCKGYGYVTVKVYKGPDLYVPTGFTPNNDGKNDKFTPFPVGIKQLKYFRVFNRWGQMVFSTNQLHDGWDGKLQGTEQQTGTYVWMAEAVTNDDKIITKKGVVTLIR